MFKAGRLKFILAMAVALIGSEAVAQKSSVSQRAAGLLEEVNNDGIIAVASRATDSTDLDILDLLTRFKQNFNGAEEAHRIIKSRSSSAIRFFWTWEPSSSRELLANGVRDFDISYSVGILNGTSTTLDDVIVFYKATDNDYVEFAQALKVQAGVQQPFFLGPCSKLESYTVGAFVGSRMVARIPTGGGNMTPQLASLLKPEDTATCLDAWTIY